MESKSYEAESRKHWDQLHEQSRFRPRFPNDHVVRFLLGNYSLQGTSPAISHDTCSNNTGACMQTINASGVTAITVPGTDFFGNNRPDTGRNFDVGAVEVPNQ